MLNVKDALLRVKGSRRWIWRRRGIRHAHLAAAGQARQAATDPSDVISAIKQQNIQAPAGQIGASPSKPDQQFTYTVRAPGKFSTPEEFGEILVRATADGRQIRVKDVARVELGGEFYKSFGRFNGKPARRAAGLSAAGREPDREAPKASTTLES